MIKKGTAQLVSLALNPVFVTALTLAVALVATQSDQKRAWGMLIVVLNVVAPIALAIALVNQGVAIDDTLHNRRVKRERLYMIVPLVVIGLVQWWLAQTKEVGQPLTAAIAATTLLTALVAVISFSWKISAHLTSISGLIFIAGIIYGLAALWLVALIPIASWARRKLERHTVKQLVAGTLIAPLVIIPVFYLYGVF